jgi:hypothetical protein
MKSSPFGMVSVTDHLPHTKLTQRVLVTHSPLQHTEFEITYTIASADWQLADSQPLNNPAYTPGIVESS